MHHAQSVFRQVEKLVERCSSGLLQVMYLYLPLSNVKYTLLPVTDIYFQQILTGILNKYIGTYFEDIDASQLTGNIFGGGVSLHNLKLRPTVFESLGIPFHVIAGKCGTLEVKYSITKLYSEPVIVNLRDLYVLIVPSQSIQYDAEMEEDEHQSEKMRQLEVFESVKHHLSHPQEHRSSLLGT